MSHEPDPEPQSTIFIRKAGPDGQAVKFKPTPAKKPEATTLSELSVQQRKSGLAAWLGWLFDGLDMHLYGLVSAPFVAYLLHKQGLLDDAADVANKVVAERSGWIQAAMLVGWALGGGFFGRLGDLLGRSRALSLTILTYALFTGMAFFAQNWWQLLIFRFLAGLGIGGEWAVGSSLLSETWPKKWRPWIAAVLQTGVNLGVMLAGLTTLLMADTHPKWVFLVGVLPALMVFWIRRHVPEPEEWHAAKRESLGLQPGVIDLFRGAVRRTTILTIIVCACGLTAWWAFQFWMPHHLRNLPDLDVLAKGDLAKNIASYQVRLQGSPAVDGPTKASFGRAAADFNPQLLGPGALDPAARAEFLKHLAVVEMQLTNAPAFTRSSNGDALEELKRLNPDAAIRSFKQKVVSRAFSIVIGVSILGNFAAAGLAKLLGYRRSIALFYCCFFLAMGATFIQPRGWESLVWFWFPLVGFCSGIFGLFTMYLPPLFPTLLRTTGAGFCYNIGRIASALGVIYSGSLASGGDFKKTLLFAACLFVPAIFVALALPEPKDLGGHATETELTAVE
ncbi:MAG: MFS transporter [Proteobacteria bacterium]|nr:MFS transporter [Pseudomonadota bacterium]